MRKCTKCGETKDLRYFHKDKRVKDGRMAACIDCRKRVRKRYDEENPNYKWKAKLKYKYNMEVEEYEKLLESQGFRCGICAIHINDYDHKTMRYFSVDHNHVTGANRGLLCNKCNMAIGLLEDSSLLCHNAYQYLTLHDGEEF